MKILLNYYILTEENYFTIIYENQVIANYEFCLLIF